MTHSSAGEPGRVRALSFHADYACGNSGACCSAGWPIPVEAHVLPMLTDALERRVVTRAGDGPSLAFPGNRPASIGGVLGRTPTGACVFFDAAQRGGHCRVHRGAGVAAMPIACRQFPRIARHDTRGTDVSLSHWCPTAVACLEQEGPVSIVEGPSAFPSAHRFDGLEAQGAWPPLLRPDCLFDADGYEQLERHVVAMLTRDGHTLSDRLAGLGTWFEYLRQWRPARGPLADDVVATRPTVQFAPAWCASNTESLWRDVIDAIPDDLRARVPDDIHRPAPDAEALLTLPFAERVLGRYLAARFFGSWLAYQGHGLRSTLASLHAGLTVVRHALGEHPQAEPAARLRAAVRTADLLLVHLAAPEILARRFSQWERRMPLLTADATSAATAS